MCQRADEKRRGEQIDYRTEQMAQQVRQERETLFFRSQSHSIHFFLPFALWDRRRVLTRSCCSDESLWSHEDGSGVCLSLRGAHSITHGLSHTHYSKHKHTAPQHLVNTDGVTHAHTCTHTLPPQPPFEPQCLHS